MDLINLQARNRLYQIFETCSSYIYQQIKHKIPFLQKEYEESIRKEEHEVGDLILKGQISKEDVISNIERQEMYAKQWYPKYSRCEQVEKLLNEAKLLDIKFSPQKTDIIPKFPFPRKTETTDIIF